MVFELAETCEKNKDYEVALECYNYIISIGRKSPYYLDSKVAVLRVLQLKVLSTNKYTQQDLLTLKTEYEKTLLEIDGTSYSTRLRKDLAHLEAFYFRNSTRAIEILEVAINSGYARRQDVAMCKIQLADILILENDIWEAALLYGQVEKEFKEDVIGQEAKFKRARVSYYVGEFSWAQAQLDVLKTSTSKLIANDAMALSLLIQDNLALDTTDAPLLIYARADLLSYQLRFDEALQTLDSLESEFGWHGIIDESIFLRAQVHMSRRDFKAAESAYLRIISGYSWELTGDDAHYELGKLYEEYLGDKAKAMEMYEALMLNYPGSIYIVDARKRYRALRGDKMDDI
jgi:tetratricopeptide (TPR) repeat protein